MAHFKLKLKLVFQVFGSGPDFWSEILAENDQIQDILNDTENWQNMGQHFH